MAAIYHLAHCRLEGQTGHAAGRALLAQLYQTHVGTPMPDICEAPGGKPYFSRGNWHFSISHTKHHAFCVLSTQPIGLDAEEMDRAIDLRLANSILSAGEKQQFDAAEDPRTALLSFWVLKEAASKQSGKGIGFHPRHTDFVLPDPRITEIDNCLVAVVY